MRVAGLADAFQDAVRAMHDTRRANALGVVRHEGAHGVALRVVRRVDARTAGLRLGTERGGRARATGGPPFWGHARRNRPSHALARRCKSDL